jgi:putative transposase
MLEVSTSGFWAWRKRPPSSRALADRELLGRIAEVYKLSDSTYGVPRMFDELYDQGVRCGRKRIARLMRANTLVGCHRRSRRPRTTTPETRAPAAPDLVNRQFHPDAPDTLWLADITYIRTWSGFLYLAVVLDAFSRRVVGWAMRDHLRTELVMEALEMALWNRRPAEGTVILHSDRGSQYRSLAFGQRCRDAGIMPSMGRVGSAYDNAMCESFFATLECELLDRNTYRTRSEAKLSVFHFIEVFYNRWRRHTSLNLSGRSASPVAYEADYWQTHMPGASGDHAPSDTLLGLCPKPRPAGSLGAPPPDPHLFHTTGLIGRSGVSTRAKQVRREAPSRDLQ